MRLSIFFVLFSCVAINFIQLVNTSPLFDTKSLDIKRQDFNISDPPDVFLHESQEVMASIEIKFRSITVSIDISSLLSQFNLSLDKITVIITRTVEALELNPLLASIIATVISLIKDLIQSPPTLAVALPALVGGSNLDQSVSLFFETIKSRYPDLFPKLISDP
ncbi:hypothetical protein FRC12_016728 [Ceratobasidium sp. 428]|nr:hypothetical protein FRC12_016728 [Ceratobasidium sp. 428]